MSQEHSDQEPIDDFCLDDNEEFELLCNQAEAEQMK